MAESKKKSTKSTATSNGGKKSTAKKKATSKPSAPAKPKGPSYEQLLVARRAMDAAHSEVRQAERELRSAHSYMADFVERDKKVAAAREKLDLARSEAAEATIRFQQMKYEAKNV